MTIVKSSLIILISVVLSLVVQHYWPEQQIRDGEDIFGTSLTTINATDKVSDSRTTINDNFTALNTGKLEVSGGTMTGYLFGTGLNMTYATITNATTTHLALSGASAASGNYCLQINTTGVITNTGSACIASSGSSAWQWDATNKGITPTTTGAGIYLTGSATTTGYYYGNLVGDVTGNVTGALTGNADTATNLSSYASAYTWTGINTWSSDGRFTGGLHATTTDFDVLTVNGNATTTGSFALSKYGSCTLKTNVGGDVYCGTDNTGSSNVATSTPDYALFNNTTATQTIVNFEVPANTLIDRDMIHIVITIDNWIGAGVASNGFTWTVEFEGVSIFGFEQSPADAMANGMGGMIDFWIAADGANKQYTKMVGNVRQNEYNAGTLAGDIWQAEDADSSTQDATSAKDLTVQFSMKEAHANNSMDIGSIYVEYIQ